MATRRVVAVLLFVSLPTLAQEGRPSAAPPLYSVEPANISTAPVIDGRLDEAVWQEASLIGGFVQYEPKEGEPASEPTEVRIAYDSNCLYFGVRAHAAQPEKLVANIMRRDGDLSNDESIQILLDTYHDRRNAYFFAVNPLGAQADGLIRNEGEQVSFDQDELWKAATHRDAHGWTAEIAIPFKALRFNPGEQQVWGMNVRRFIAHKREETHWRPILRSWGFLGRFKVSEFGELRGMHGLAPSGRYHLVPYAVARNHQSDGFGPQEGFEQGEIGGDLKWNITSNLVAAVTVNPDFSEAEPDRQQVNLTPYEPFYPEQRQLFLAEGADIFYFGERIEPYDVPERFLFFYSRRIGYAQDGLSEVPLEGGATVSGRLGKTGVGLLSLTSEETAYADAQGQRVAEPRTRFTAVRLKQEIYKKSSIGLIGLSKDPSGENANRGFGFDWNLALGKRLSTIGFLARTQTPGLAGDDSAMSADLLYQGKHLRARTMVLDIGDDFHNELGFITRTGIRKSQTVLGWIFAPQRRAVHRALFAVDFNHVDNQRGQLESQVTKVELNLSAKTRDGVAFLYYDNVEVLPIPLVLQPGLVIAPGYYHFRNLFTGVSSSYTRPLGFTAWYDTGSFYGGKRLRELASVVYRPMDGLLLSLTWDRQKVDLSDAAFLSDLVYSDFNYSFTPRLFTRTRLQWSRQDSLRANVLLDWALRPGSNLYLAYNEIEDLHELRRFSTASPLTPGRTLTLKLKQGFDF